MLTVHYDLIIILILPNESTSCKFFGKFRSAGECIQGANKVFQLSKVITRDLFLSRMTKFGRNLGFVHAT